MKDKLRKHMFTKRIIRRITFHIANGLSIGLNTYALIRPTVPGAITWLDSVTNRPLKVQIERSLICEVTGALIQEPPKRFQPYRNENVKFSMDEIAEIKRISTGHLRLLGFKPLSCLEDYHNLKPSTFVYPSDQIIATKLINLLETLQDEITRAGGQMEPPGMHMIYLPYSDDIRDAEEARKY
ncbi:hypothetical protein REPUB_Repub11eG0033600 [Reevesia pubescens]